MDLLPIYTVTFEVVFRLEDWVNFILLLEQRKFQAVNKDSLAYSPCAKWRKVVTLNSQKKREWLEESKVGNIVLVLYRRMYGRRPQSIIESFSATARSNRLFHWIVEKLVPISFILLLLPSTEDRVFQWRAACIAGNAKWSLSLRWSGLSCAYVYYFFVYSWVVKHLLKLFTR